MEFIRFGNIIFKTAHIVAVEKLSDGGVKFFLTQGNLKNKFVGEEADHVWRWWASQVPNVFDYPVE